MKYTKRLFFLISIYIFIYLFLFILELNAVSLTGRATWVISVFFFYKENHPRLYLFLI